MQKKWAMRWLLKRVSNFFNFLLFLDQFLIKTSEIYFVSFWELIWNIFAFMPVNKSKLTVFLGFTDSYWPMYFHACNYKRTSISMHHNMLMLFVLFTFGNIKILQSTLLCSRGDLYLWKLSKNIIYFAQLSTFFQ